MTWQDVPAYRQVVFESGLADVAKELMGSTTVRFFHEHVLVKEPGTNERTPWHHDQPYYCVDGDQNVSMWIALDPVPASAGVRFIAGSHRWNRWFVPRKFVDHTPYAEGVGRYELVPDLDAELDRHSVLAWDVEPGDVIAFHFRTLHDAPGNSLDHAPAGGEPAVARRRRDVRAPSLAALAAVRAARSRRGTTARRRAVPTRRRLTPPPTMAT